MPEQYLTAPGARPSQTAAPSKPVADRLDEHESWQEDALAYLRCSSISVFRKGQLIYGPDQPCTHLFLVIDGTVKVSRVAEGGQEIVLDIYLRDEFFGESSLASLHPGERVVALENTQLMTWSVQEIEDTITRQPRLGLALLQIVVKRTLDFRHRVESLSNDNVVRRLARSLIRFSERLGKPQEDGSILFAPFTHAVLAQYVGTSREIVTLHMTQFRRKGYLRYSRKGIVLYRAAMEEWLAGPYPVG